ncbi:MAG: alginate lyase family protein [Acidobacteriaceae bacterium]|nr:alginate lyase family protein [Acidobacteriaceae bacterium]
MFTSRRIFCCNAAALLFTPTIAKPQTGVIASSRPDVAAIDRDRILKAANGYLAQAPAPLTTLPCPRSPGSAHDFYSEADDYWPDPSAPSAPYTQRAGERNPAAFTAHRDALLNLGLAVPALTAAYVLTHEDRYASTAAAHLNAWFVTPATRMTPSLLYGQTILPAKTGRPEGVVEAVFLGEIAQCLPFLSTSNALPQSALDAVTDWFTEYYQWLTTSRLAGLARDRKDHHASSWLLQTTACARLNTKDDRPLSELRHQFEHTTIRAQILADGSFPHELATPWPYRNSLFNLDMLAGVANLLTTRFETVWTYDLLDGPGIRSAVARHYPFILNRAEWPYPADPDHFTALPLRRPSLLLAARAFNQAEYADLWKKLPPDTDIPDLQRTFPIAQPLLWVTRPRP